MIASLLLYLAVFGIELDRPLTLPECSKEPIIPGAQPTYSVKQTATCTEYGPVQRKGGNDSQLIVFDSDTSPTILNGSVASVFVRKGIVVGFQGDTAGVETGQLVLDQLTKKFGKPTGVRSIPVQNLSGASFQRIVATWDTPAASVSFDSAPYRIDDGRITILTPGAKLIEDVIQKADQDARTPL